MFRLIVVSCLLAACAAQVDPKDAKILKEQRFNAGDGRAGAAFATEDGTVFREETDANGNRIGQYSYIDNEGKTFTVRYSAGKDGFRILEGDHIRATGQDAAQFGAEDYPTEEEEFVPEPVQIRAQPAPVPQQPLPVAPRPVVEAAPVDPNFNPFVNPHDPTHRDFQFNKNGATFAPNSPVARTASLVPDCADCAGVNPFINPFDASHQQGGALAGHLAGFGVPQQRAQPAQPARPVQVAPVQEPRQAFLPVPATRPVTEPTPKRFFPPGQLKLNRFETGFNFDFES